MLLAMGMWGCSVTPEEHRDLAFRQYSLECVARGIPENTQAHTQCVLDKYEKYHAERRHAEERMSEVFAEKDKNVDQTNESDSETN